MPGPPAMPSSLPSHSAGSAVYEAIHGYLHGGAASRHRICFSLCYIRAAYYYGRVGFVGFPRYQLVSVGIVSSNGGLGRAVYDTSIEPFVDDSPKF